MKRCLAALIALLLALSLCSCGESTPPETPAAEPAEEQASKPAEITAEPAPEEAEPEKTYVERTAELPARLTEVGIPDDRIEMLGPVMHSGSRVTEYLYDE